MGELVKDLLNILTKEVIRCGDSVETRKTEAYFLAARLTELGYIKVVRCGECKWWTDSGDKMLGTCKKPHRRADISTVNFYCSEGEPKEGTNA